MDWTLDLLAEPALCGEGDDECFGSAALARSGRTVAGVRPTQAWQ